jgi:YHS domain-containing protein
VRDKNMKKFEMLAVFLCASIFLQTLYFKFTGAAESVWIFTSLGIEPWGRWGSGIIELIAAILLLKSSTRFIGAFLSLGIMGSAILSHLVVLGVVVENDGGLLFILALVCFISALFIIYAHRKQIPLKYFTAGLMIILPFLSHAKVSYNTKSEFAIQGHDPVSYILDQKAQKGKKEFKATFDGLDYLFESAEHKVAFLKSPEKFIPAYGGWCAYAMAEGEKVDIDPKTFKIIEGRTYLFYNGLWGNTLEKWKKDETNLKKNADKSWQEIIK